MLKIDLNEMSSLKISSKIYLPIELEKVYRTLFPKLKNQY